MRILLSKINLLGDAVTFLPTLGAVAQAPTTRELVMICTPVARAVFETLIPPSNIFDVPYSAARGRRAAATLFSTLRALRGRRFDLSCHSYDEPSFSYVLAACLRIPRRIGFRSGIARLEFLLTERLPFDASRNVVDLNFDLARRALGEAPAPRRVPLAYSAADRDTSVQRLIAAGVPSAGRFVVVHPESKLEYRQWDLDRFLALVDRIELGAGAPVVIVTERAPAQSPRRRWITGLSLRQLAALLDMASVFVGNNSGPMHVAAAMGTPCVVIQGPTAPNWEIYFREVPHRIIKMNHLPCIPCERLGSIPGRCTNTTSPKGCLAGIDVPTVEAAVLELLRASDS